MESEKTSNVMNRFSIVTALLVLNFTVLFFLPSETSGFSIQVANTEFSFSLVQLIPVLIAGISMVGSFWVLHANPSFFVHQKGLKPVLPNLVLPTITVLIFSLILIQTDKTITWWFLMVLGLLVYMAVFFSEYQVLKPDIGANTIFSILLIVLAHGLFMAMAIALRASTNRVFILIPGLLVSSAFVAYRTIYLRSEGQAKLSWILLVTAIITQFGVALYYLFLTPNQYGLILTAILFASNAMTARIGQGDIKKLYIEPLILILFIVILFLISKLV